MREADEHHDPIRAAHAAPRLPRRHGCPQDGRCPTDMMLTPATRFYSVQRQPVTGTERLVAALLDGAYSSANRAAELAPLKPF